MMFLSRCQDEKIRDENPRMRSSPLATIPGHPEHCQLLTTLRNHLLSPACSKQCSFALPWDIARGTLFAHVFDMNNKFHASCSLSSGRVLAGLVAVTGVKVDFQPDQFSNLVPKEYWDKQLRSQCHHNGFVP
ncbi:hypothetical protein BTVI_53250 [Pitangus sulphuratus]|nr:hypothetical protein BTVI_53250 [Pitangus sulphuratus]